MNLNDLPFDSISKHLSLLVKELLNVVLWVTSNKLWMNDPLHQIKCIITWE